MEWICSCGLPHHFNKPPIGYVCPFGCGESPSPEVISPSTNAVVVPAPIATTEQEMNTDASSNY